MAVEYQKVWRTMNDLEVVTSKICSAREILDCAIDAHQEHKYEKVEHLLYAVDEYLQYYLKEFDNKFKDAWQATVGDLRDGDVKYDTIDTIEQMLEKHQKLICGKDDPSPECKGAWNDFWEEHYYPEEYQGSTVSSVKSDKVKKWVLPVEETKIAETDETEYFVSFPDDLLEAANLKEGDQVEWVDKGDGSYLIKKVENPSWVKGNELSKVKTYQEMIEDGWELTDDGFWIKEN